MTNREKFIEVMNETFNAGFTLENFSEKYRCSPCGYYKRHKDGCEQYDCFGCWNWWNKEYTKEMNS